MSTATTGFKKLYEETLKQLQDKDKEVTELKNTIEEMKRGMDQLIGVSNGNLDTLKSNLIQTLAQADNCRIVVQPAPAVQQATTQK